MSRKAGNCLPSLAFSAFPSWSLVWGTSELSPRGTTIRTFSSEATPEGLYNDSTKYQPVPVRIGALARDSVWFTTRLGRPGVMGTCLPTQLTVTYDVAVGCCHNQRNRQKGLSEDYRLWLLVRCPGCIQHTSSNYT